MVAAADERRGQRVGCSYSATRRSTSASETSADPPHQVAHAVAVDRVAEAELGLDLVALGHGHLPHVVAEAGDLSGLRSSAQAGGGPHPGAPDGPAPRRPASGRRPPCRGSCRSRVQMKPNSRSPWAAWLRFMKSMSMVDQGKSRLYCVCRWTNGFCRPSARRSTSWPARRCASSRIKPAQSARRVGLAADFEDRLAAW